LCIDGCTAGNVKTLESGTSLILLKGPKALSAIAVSSTHLLAIIISVVGIVMMLFFDDGFSILLYDDWQRAHHFLRKKKDGPATF
jgi:hypothetical protein